MSDFSFYIDESYDNNGRYTVLAGVIVPHNKWKILNDKIKNLKKEYFNDQNFNLKFIRRNNYHKEGKKWKKLSTQQKSDFNDKFFSILDDGITLIVSVIDKDKMRRKDKNKIFKLAYSFLLERFEYFLDEFPDTYGMVVYDKAKSSKEVTCLSDLHRQIMEEGVTVDNHTIIDNPDGTITPDYENKKRRPINNIIENMSFQSDNYNNFIQIADMAASAFSSEYNRKITKYSAKYKTLLRKNDKGNVTGFGIKIFPK